MKSVSDVVVLGGGIIGLSIAWELARRGGVVTVLERDAPGHGASWAAAGMLAPYTEDIDDLALRELATRSLHDYPQFARELHAASGVDIRLNLSGILEVAYDEAHALRLAARERRLVESGVRLQRIDDAELPAYDPALARGAHTALLCADEGQVDNRRLGRALDEAARRAGVRIRRDCPALALEYNVRRVLGVRTHEGFLAASVVVNALGAWAAWPQNLPAHLVAPVRPVKGQMLAVSMPTHYLQHVVWAAGVYLVPRDDGRLLVGATVEDQGFDRRITAGGIRSLLDGMIRALPGSESFALCETWSGVRPGSPDGRPFLGATELDGYVLATGHYRNGVLLTPVTARVIADELCDVAPIDAAFSLGRLQRGSAVMAAKTPA